MQIKLNILFLIKTIINYDKISYDNESLIIFKTNSKTPRTHPSRGF